MATFLKDEYITLNEAIGHRDYLKEKMRPKLAGTPYQATLTTDLIELDKIIEKFEMDAEINDAKMIDILLDRFHTECKDSFFGTHSISILRTLFQEAIEWGKSHRE